MDVMRAIYWIGVAGLILQSLPQSPWRWAWRFIVIEAVGIVFWPFWVACCLIVFAVDLWERRSSPHHP